MRTGTCDNCYGTYEPDIEGADGLCEECYGDQFEDDTEESGHAE